MRLRWLLVSVLSASLFGLVACGGGNSGYLPPVSSKLVPYEPPEVAQEGAEDTDPEFGPKDDGADDDDDTGAGETDSGKDATTAPPPAGGAPSGADATKKSK
jgi:hypothetical protein